MAEILYGAPVREKIKADLIKRIEGLEKKPVLVIVQVGDRPDSNIYIRNKIKFGEEVGAEVRLEKLNIERLNDSEKEVLEIIERLNKDENVNGIIVQLPLPAGFNTEKVVASVSKSKDADGLVGSEGGGEMVVTPATARAVMRLLDFYKVEVRGKKAAVIGRSRLAGGPIARSLEEAGAEVYVCHRETPNIPDICRGADIIVSAAGQPNLVTKDYVKEGQVVIDVGINKVSNEIIPSTPLTLSGELERTDQKSEKQKLVGDVAFYEVEPIVSAITPVPGGVGPLTVACLFENLIDLC